MSEYSSGLSKRALLIGINQYPYLPAYSQLKGCVNDVNRMRDVLQTLFDFPKANITLLTDEQATQKNIRDAMERLVADTAKGDIILFHYSGHGSRSLAAKGDKPGGYDETIMPSDSGRLSFATPAENRDIRDTEIQEWLLRLSKKTPHITLVFDSCHSGSITRWAGSEAAEADGTRLRWIPPDLPPNEMKRSASLPDDGRMHREVTGSGWLPRGENYVLLAACAAEQGAFELDHNENGTVTRHGAFTFFLTQELYRPSEIKTYRDIWEQVVIKVANRFQNQTPQLEGTRDKHIFHVYDIVPMRYLLIDRRQDDQVNLQGGAVHGLTVGSQWDVYPAGAKQISEGADKTYGCLEITAAESVTATANILWESEAGIIQPGARAIEVLHVDQEPRMPVWLSPSAGYEAERDELRKILTRSAMLEVTENPGAAYARIVAIMLHESAVMNSSLPVQDASTPLWEVTNAVLLMPRCPIPDPLSAPRIRDNLEAIWRYKKVLELRNEKSALQGKIDFTLLKMGTDGLWHEVSGGDAPEEVTYRDGNLIAFRVTNHYQSPVYVSVLDFGLSKRIEVLYPVDRASEQIAPKRSGEATLVSSTGGVLSVGTEPGQKIVLYFPDDLPMFRVMGDAKAPRGREVFKLVVTTKPHDLSFLQQGGLRNYLPAEHPLEELIYLASSGELKREARRLLAPQDEWLTIERAFWLQK